MEQLRIAQMQQALGINDAELARRLGTNQTQLGRLKKGDRGMSIEWMRRFAKALECTVADLLGPQDYPNRPGQDDLQLLSQIRATGTDPYEMLDLLTALDKFVVRQAARRSTAHQLDGDPHVNAQMAEIWAQLAPQQRGHMIDMMRAASRMNGGMDAAA